MARPSVLSPVKAYNVKSGRRYGIRKPALTSGAERFAASQLPSLLVWPARVGAGAKHGGGGAKLAGSGTDRVAPASGPHRVNLRRTNHRFDPSRWRDRRSR